jgi:anti-sigma B factor antagonist
MTIDESLLISVENKLGRTRVIVRGEVDLVTATRFRDELLRQLAVAKSLWLDLEGVKFMDSSGLHVLVASHRRAALLGGHLVIDQTSTAVERLLEVSGTTALFARAANQVHGGPTVASVDGPRAANGSVAQPDPVRISRHRHSSEL